MIELDVWIFVKRLYDYGYLKDEFLNIKIVLKNTRYLSRGREKISYKSCKNLP